jgi:hypothetical protein
MSVEYAERTAGDIGQYIDLQVDGLANLSGVTSATAHIWRRDTEVNLAASITDGTARTIRIMLGGAGGWLPTLNVDSPRKDVWQLKVRTIWGDGSEVTIPSGRPLRIGIAPNPGQTP